MSEFPFFSIILPSYNRASMIAKAIESIISQLFTDWELIFIDDASVDNTEDIVKQFKDTRIKYFKNNINIERSASRNIGINNAKGQYICFIDSDDYCLNNHLLAFYNKITELKFPVAMLYCNTYEEENGNLKKIENAKVVSDYKNLKNLILYPIALCKVCVNSKILQKNKFNENYRIGEDMDLWFRILKEYPLIHVDNYSYVINIHQGRTVINEEIYARISNLKLAKKIIRDNKNLFTNNDRMEIISSSYFSLSKTYFNFNHFGKMLINLLKSFIYQPLSKKNKEKAFMIYSSLKNAFK